MKIVTKEPQSYEEKDTLSSVQQQLAGRSYPRKELVNILKEYNQLIGNDAHAFKQIERLGEDKSVCVFTGQQLGLLGGPSYTILKALTCLLVAKEANAIPIFWLATEDHDVAEISQTYLLNGVGNLQKFSLHFPKDGRCVEDLEWSARNLEVMEQLLQSVKVPSNAFFLKENKSYALSMAHYLAMQFAGTGLIFIEPRFLRPLAVPFFQKEIEESEQILEILRETTRRLEEAGGHSVLSLKEGTNLFYKEQGLYRRKIRLEGQNFLIGERNYSKKQLLSLIQNEPEKFTTNVASRPILQSKLFPTVAYVAGPTEIAYFKQLGDYHRFHDVPVPSIIPRLSATLIPPRAQKFLSQSHLNPWDSIPHHWVELMPSIVESTQAATGEWISSAKHHFPQLPPEMMGRYIRRLLQLIQKKACKAELKRQAIPSYALHYLRNLIHPHGKFQERVLNWNGFQAEAEENLVLSFLEQAQWRSEGHLYSNFV